MAGLTVPTPVLEPLLPRNVGEPDSTYLVIEKPLAVRGGGPALADGTPVPQRDLATSGCLLYRRMAAAAQDQVWDAAHNQWFDESTAQGRAAAPVAMSLVDVPPRPWRGVLSGAAMLPEATDPVTGFPTFFARTVFATHGGRHAGTSQPSAAIKLFSLRLAMRAEIELAPNDPSQASKLRLHLLDGAHREIGALSIADAAGGSGRRIELVLRNPASGPDVGGITIAADPDPKGTIEIKNQGGALVRLTSAGDVELKPQTGGRVIVIGRLVGRSAVTGDHDVFVP